MTIKLLQHTSLSIMATAGRTAWQSFHKGGIYENPTDEISDTDVEFIDRIINKHKHGSVSEHVMYNFSIEDISRACLQELARHRIASLTVKSSRYTLNELKSEEPFTSYTDLLHQEYISDGYERASKYLVFTGNAKVDRMSILALDNLRDLVVDGISNDQLKYAMPEAYKTSLIWSVNARSLQNFLSLRSDKAALWEIRNLAFAIYNQIPDDHKFLFEASIKE